jgi:hypothetical protein
MSRRCRVCGDQFRPDGDWQRLCWPCWREANDVKANPPAPPKIVQVPVETVPADVLRQAIRLTHPPGRAPDRTLRAGERGHRCAARCTPLTQGRRLMRRNPLTERSNMTDYGAHLIVHDREMHLEVADTNTLAVGDTVDVIRGNGPREGDRMGIATVTGFASDGAPLLDIHFEPPEVVDDAA